MVFYITSNANRMKFSRYKLTSSILIFILLLRKMKLSRQTMSFERWQQIQWLHVNVQLTTPILLKKIKIKWERKIKNNHHRHTHTQTPRCMLNGFNFFFSSSFIHPFGMAWYGMVAFNIMCSTHTITIGEKNYYYTSSTLNWLRKLNW